MFKKLLQATTEYDLLIKMAKEQPVYMFHGTKKSKLSSIMSSGLLANPKKRVWNNFDDASFDMPAMSSLSGVYMASDINTALWAARNGSNEKDQSNTIIFMMRIQPKSLFLDEDSIDSIIDYLSGGSGPLRKEDYIKLYLYYFLPSKQDKLAQKMVDYAKFLTSTLSNIQPKLHAKLIKRVSDLAMKYFFNILSRRVAHVDQFVYSNIWDQVSIGTEKSYDPPPPKPNIEDGEKLFKEYQDQLTRTLKLLADPHREYKPNGILIARLPEDIGFSGANRIVAVLEVHKGTLFGPPMKLKFIYPSSIKDLPEDAAMALTSNIVAAPNTRLFAEED